MFESLFWFELTPPEGTISLFADERERLKNPLKSVSLAPALIAGGC